MLNSILNFKEIKEKNYSSCQSSWNCTILKEEWNKNESK